MNEESPQNRGSESAPPGDRREDPEPVKHADAERVSTEEADKVPGRDEADSGSGQDGR